MRYFPKGRGLDLFGREYPPRPHRCGSSTTIRTRSPASPQRDRSIRLVDFSSMPDPRQKIAACGSLSRFSRRVYRWNESVVAASGVRDYGVDDGEGDPTWRAQSYCRFWGAGDDRERTVTSMGNYLNPHSFDDRPRNTRRVKLHSVGDNKCHR